MGNVVTSTATTRDTKVYAPERGIVYTMPQVSVTTASYSVTVHQPTPRAGK